MRTRPDRLSLILIGAVGLVALLPGVRASPHRERSDRFIVNTKIGPS